VTIVHCFGAGLVGSYVAVKLADSGHLVHVYDIDGNNSKLNNHQNISFHKCDVFDLDLATLGSGGVFVNMLPGEIGHALTSRLANEPGRRIVDLSFSEKTPDMGLENGIATGTKVLWDVGIAPGLSNMFLAVASRIIGELETAEIRVGGNPIERDGEWDYMAPFSPKDVIAEYTRPARVVRAGGVVILPALSERHMLDIPEFGVMEAFLTDGLRSVIDSIPAKEMSEYTVRWPGHIERFIQERETGSLNLDELMNEWKFDPDAPEFTWLQVLATGRNHAMRWTVRDLGGDDGSSMARTTGLVTVGCIQAWIERPDMLTDGVHPPEALPQEVVESVIGLMRSNGIDIQVISGTPFAVRDTILSL